MTKFQRLSKREKVEHIWEYYRYHIIGGIVGTLMMVSILTTVFGPRLPEAAVNIVVMGSYGYNDEKLEDFKENIQDSIDNDEDGKIEVSMFPVDWNSHSSMDMAMSQKLVLMFQTREIDIMIIEETKFDSFITNMDEVIYEVLEGKPELAKTLEENEGNLVKRRLDGDSKEKVYGLSVKDNKKLQEIGLTDDYVISIPIISEKKENALKTIKWLYE